MCECDFRRTERGARSIALLQRVIEHRMSFQKQIVLKYESVGQDPTEAKVCLKQLEELHPTGVTILDWLQRIWLSPIGDDRNRH